MTKSQNKCSYCEIPGHNRRTCDELKKHSDIFSMMNKKYIKLVIEDLVSRGIAPGTLVEYVQAIDGKEEITAMGLVTEFLWEELFFRKPSKRWIKVHIVGNPTVKHGSYVFSVSTPWGWREKTWRIRFPHHELRREWSSDARIFTYMPELKKMTSGEYSSIISSSRIAGYWRVASPLPSSSVKIIGSSDKSFLAGKNNVKEWFENIGFLGGERECKTIRTSEWK